MLRKKYSYIQHYLKSRDRFFEFFFVVASYLFMIKYFSLLILNIMEIPNFSTNSTIPTNLLKIIYYFIEGGHKKHIDMNLSPDES